MAREIVLTKVSRYGVHSIKVKMKSHEDVFITRRESDGEYVTPIQAWTGKLTGFKDNISPEMKLIAKEFDLRRILTKTVEVRRGFKCLV